MDPQTLADCFTAAGLDSKEALAAFLSTARAQVDLKALDLKIDALNQKRQEVLKPINDEQIDLQNQRNAIIVELAAAKARAESDVAAIEAKVE